MIPQVIFLLCRLETERAAKNAPRMPGNRRDRSPEYPSDGHRPENPSPKRRLRHRPPFRAADGSQNGKKASNSEEVAWAEQAQRARHRIRALCKQAICCMSMPAPPAARCETSEFDDLLPPTAHRACSGRAREARFAARARGETRSAIRIEAPSGRPERPSSTLVALGHHKPDPFPSTSFAASPSTSPKPSLKLLGTTTVPPVSRTLSYKRCIARRRSAASFFA